MARAVVLDPKEVATADRKELSLEASGITVRKDPGPEWGDAAIEAYVAKQSYGAAMIDYVLPPRKIVIPLVVSGSSDAVFDNLRATLEAKVQRINEEGGWIKRVTPAGRTVFADIFLARLHLGAGWFAEHKKTDLEAELEFEAQPDWYGETIEVTSFEGTGGAQTTAQIKGTLPGRVDFTITEKGAVNQLGLAWHFRCRNYTGASTAEWRYEAEALTPLDTAAKQALTGSSGETIRHNNLAASWTPVLNTNLLAGTYLTHAGLYDVWARVYTTSATPPYLRLLYGVGDTVTPVENRQVQVPRNNQFYMVPLGQINLRKARYGTHRWQGVIQARGASGGENIYIDQLYFFCGDESSGILKAPMRPNIGVSTYSAREEFNQAEGALTGKVLPVGGTWTAVAESDADDFLDDVAGSTLGVTYRNIGGADTVNKGRLVSAGTTNYTTIMAQLDWNPIIAAATPDVYGVHLRLTDIKNHLRVVVKHTTPNFGTTNIYTVVVEKRVASVNTVIAEKVVAGISLETWYTLTAMVDTAGRVVVWHGGQGHLPELVLACQDNVLKTGETLATGKAGLYEERTGGLGSAFQYDNFKLWVPVNDAVLFASQDLRLGTLSSARKDSAGGAYANIPYPGADAPRIPISGPEERPVEIAFRPSQGDFEQLMDTTPSAAKGALSYRPCWYSIPGE